MGRRIFITATDTGSGKSYVTTHLISLLLARGIDAVALKPVACGHDESGVNEDVATLLKAQGGNDAAQLNLYSFAGAASPNIAAAAEGARIDSDKLLAWCEREAAMHDITLIEGVGGVMVPLNEAYLVSDWIAGLNDCEVVLVIGARLGAINHALLTLRELEQCGCAPGHVIINGLDPDYAADVALSIKPFLPETCTLHQLSFDAAGEEWEPLLTGLLANHPIR